MRLEFHPEAELELIEAALHYELQVPGLGERFESEIRRATDLLLDHPEIGQLVFGSRSERKRRLTGPPSGGMRIVRLRRKPSTRNSRRLFRS
jgi:plasmid stabilization system protein ParE